MIGHAREIKFAQDGIVERYPGDQITDDEGAYNRGNDAVCTRLSERANTATMTNRWSWSWIMLLTAIRRRCVPASVWLNSLSAFGAS
ncbi:MAG: hypothetical protein IAE89_10480 [Anaerolineae bacterium]|nr:hypothetical protein [Anaerolineae bacterium]